MHNHPSGDVKPSTEDYTTTELIHVAGNVLGISLEDHIIAAGEERYSFKEHNKMQETGLDPEPKQTTQQPKFTPKKAEKAYTENTGKQNAVLKDFMGI